MLVSVKADFYRPLTLVVFPFRVFHDFHRRLMTSFRHTYGTKLRVVSMTSFTGYDKSKDKTESCKKQSIAQQRL